MQYANGLTFELNYTRMYSPAMTTIGDRLDRAMKDADILSQSELMRISGVPQATISRILKGVGAKGPESETIRRLANACKVKFEWLNEGVGDQADLSPTASSAPIENVVTPEEIIELITLYKDASAGERKLIMKAARLHLRRKLPSAADRRD